MDRAGYAEALRREGDALVAAAAATDGLTRPVPACPGWTLGDLVRHTGEVHRFWQQVAARRLRDPSEAEPVVMPPDDEVIAWFREGLAQLAATLEAADPATSVWTWSTQQDMGFIQRRMAQETAVHRWDAESAGGEGRPISADLAVDGVDEFLDIMLPAREEHLSGPAEPVRLVATDTAAGWLVTAGDSRLDVTRGAASASADEAVATVSGPASDLLLLLWRRLSPDALPLIGDGAAVGRFLARTALE